MQIIIRPCRMDEIETLRTLGVETFTDAFGSMNTPETMARYLEEAFHIDKLNAEMMEAGSEFYFLFADEELAGYLKVNQAPAQTDLNDPDSLEVERIYVRRAYQGKGLGAEMMRYALDMAERLGKRSVWLGVWEENTAAIAFYERMGFEKISRHSFRMGDELQSDWIMRKHF